MVINTEQFVWFPVVSQSEVYSIILKSQQFDWFPVDTEDDRNSHQLQGRQQVGQGQPADHNHQRLGRVRSASRAHHPRVGGQHARGSYRGDVCPLECAR